MYIGIDVGGTNISAGMVDNQGKIISELSIRTNKEGKFSDIATDMINLVKELLNTSYNYNDIQSVGIGLPGVTDSKRGIFVFAPNINVEKFPIKEFFEKELGIQTHIDNDANCAALAEAMFGSTKEFSSSITITLGTGIGGGIIINKLIFRGLNNCVGEIGHMIISVGGEQCGCGRKGCWEQYASVSALKRIAVKAAQENHNSIINKLSGWDNERISGRLIFEALKQGDQIAKQVFDKYIKFVAEGVTNIVNILDIEAIAIGGSISKQGSKLINPIKEYMEANMLCKHGSIPEICAAQFGREAGIIGAAMLNNNLNN